MILTCENCSARYLIPPHSIGAGGRRVRCTACGHEWYQTEDGQQEAEGEGRQGENFSSIDPIPESVRPLPENHALPPVVAIPHENKKHSIAGYAAAAAAMFLVLGLSIPLRNNVVELWPPSVVFYDAMGFEVLLPGEGLALDRIGLVSMTDEKGKPVLRIQGQIVNLKSGAVKVPLLKAVLNMKDGKDGESWIINLSKTVLGPQENLEFSAIHSLPPGNVKSVTLSFRQ